MNVEDFKAVKFMTAKEKYMFVKQFERFVKQGFKWDHFTVRIYEHLHLNCGFIAHYNRHGFYTTYFPGVTTDFTEHFIGPRAGNLNGVYSDVNKHIIDLLKGVDVK